LEIVCQPLVFNDEILTSMLTVYIVS